MLPPCFVPTDAYAAVMDRVRVGHPVADDPLLPALRCAMFVAPLAEIPGALGAHADDDFGLTPLGVEAMRRYDAARASL